jgi:hypothetical protein
MSNARFGNATGLTSQTSGSGDRGHSGMAKPGHLQIDPRLAAILGEPYRSSEAALKELVDNAWDADAEHVWITLPSAFSDGPIIMTLNQTAPDRGSEAASNERSSV